MNTERAGEPRVEREVARAATRIAQFSPNSLLAPFLFADVIMAEGKDE